GTANQRSVTATVQVGYQAADMTTPYADSVSVQLTPHEVERLEVRYLSPLPDPPIAGVASPYWVERGNTTALQAVAIYTDGYEQDVTTAVGASDNDASSVSVHDLTLAWSSATPELATVDSS